jgi:septal ring factor EnvC (AmiA/AmiB activator)
MLFLLFTLPLSNLNASDPEKELKEIQRKLMKEKRKIKQSIKKEKSILDELEKINKALSIKRKELKTYNSRLRETNTKIRKLEHEILLLNGKLDTRKRFLKERLKNIYKQQHGDIAYILVSAKDYQDLAKRIKYLSLLAFYDSKQMKTYKNEISDMNSKMQQLEILQKELQTNKFNIKKKTDEMVGEHEKKDILLTSVRKKRDTYKRMVKELEQSSDKLLDMIKDMADEQVPSAVVGKRGFPSLKKRLPWPVQGEVLVPYGTYKDPRFNISTFRKGIEIKADRGDTVLSVYGGRVVYADWFKGYGLLLIVNHGSGYHSLYAHLSEIFHKTGDIIKSRQAVGKIGATGLLNKPSLYFEIRHKGKPMNPDQWLRKRK